MKIKSLFTTIVSFLTLGLGSCTTLPEPEHESYSYPGKKAFIQEVDEPYQKLGVVRSKVEFPSLDPHHSFKWLCQNYYNQAVHRLVRQAQKKGADAVVKVRSVVFLYNRRKEVYKTPECADGGKEGQILTRGVAVKWKDQSPEDQKNKGNQQLRDSKENSFEENGRFQEELEQEKTKQPQNRYRGSSGDDGSSGSKDARPDFTPH